MCVKTNHDGYINTTALINVLIGSVLKPNIYLM